MTDKPCEICNGKGYTNTGKGVRSCICVKQKELINYFTPPYAFVPYDSSIPSYLNKRNAVFFKRDSTCGIGVASTAELEKKFNSLVKGFLVRYDCKLTHKTITCSQLLDQVFEDVSAFWNNLLSYDFIILKLLQPYRHEWRLTYLPQALSRLAVSGKRIWVYYDEWAIPAHLNTEDMYGSTTFTILKDMYVNTTIGKEDTSKQ